MAAFTWRVSGGSKPAQQVPGDGRWQWPRQRCRFWGDATAAVRLLNAARVGVSASKRNLSPELTMRVSKSRSSSASSAEGVAANDEGNWMGEEAVSTSVRVLAGGGDGTVGCGSASRLDSQGSELQEAAVAATGALGVPLRLPAASEAAAALVGCTLRVIDAQLSDFELLLHSSW